MRKKGYFLIFLIFIFIILNPTTVLAKDLPDNIGHKDTRAKLENSYDSWIQGSAEYTDLYSDDIVKENVFVEVSEDVANVLFRPYRWIQEMVSGFWFMLGEGINGVMRGVNGSIDLSIDNIVFGRLNSGVSINWMTFELVKDNPYGIIGATYYRLFRNLTFSIIVIMIYFVLVKETLNIGDSKKRGEMKDNLSFAMVVFILLYLMPQVTDICIYLRDWILRAIADLNGFNDLHSIGVYEVFRDMYIDSFTFTNFANGNVSIVYSVLAVAAACAPIFYIFEYLKIALKQTILFALFPVFAVLSIKNRKLMSSWVVEFFPNIFIPCIDGMLLFIPMFILKLAKTLGATHIYSTSFSVGVYVIVLVMIWSVLPMRKEILRLFGNASPLGGQRGFGGLLSAGLMAARMLGNGAKAVGGAAISAGTSGLIGDISSDFNAANYLDETAKLMNDSGKAISLGKGLSDSDISNTLNDLGAKGADFTNSVVAENTPDATSGATSFGEQMSQFDTFAEDNAIPYDKPSDLSFDEMRAENLSELDDIDSRIGEEEAMIRGYERSNNDLDMQYGEYEDELSRLDGPYAELKQDREALESYGEACKLYNENPNNPEIQAEATAVRDEAMQQIQEQNGVRLDQQEASINRRIAQMQADGTATVVDSNGVARPSDRYIAAQSQLDEIQKQREENKTYKGASSIMQESVNERQRNLDSKREDIASHQQDIRRAKAENIHQINESRANLKDYEDKRRTLADREHSFAYISKNSGQSGDRFSGNGVEFQNYQKKKELAKRYATLNNFDSKAFVNDLDPETKAKFYRQRATNKVVNQAVNVAVNAAGTGVKVGLTVGGASLGAVAGTYGGSQAMTSGATVGGLAGNMAGSKMHNDVSRGVNKAQDIITATSYPSRPKAKAKTTPLTKEQIANNAKKNFDKKAKRGNSQ